MEEKDSKKDETVKQDFGGLRLKKSEVWKYSTIFFIVLLIISVATSGFRGISMSSGIGADKAAEKAVSYINANLLQPGSAATLNGVTEKAGVYAINISIAGKDYESYVSKDGKILFTSGMEMVETTAQPAAETATAAPEPEKATQDIPKTDKPKMSIWIESRCPFGIQAANGIARVYDVMKGKANIELRYMVSDNNGEISAMHGPEELAEDRREVCIREEQGYDIFMKYMRCYAETGQSTECEPKSGVDSKKLATCVDTKSTEYLKKDAADWKTIYVPKGGSGSPSFFLNDVKINEYASSQNGRSPDNLRSIICSNMKTSASGCNATLPTANPPRGFGVIESGTAATTAAPASCD